MLSCQTDSFRTEEETEISRDMKNGCGVRGGRRRE